MCKYANVTAETLDLFLIGESAAMRKLRADIVNASRWHFPVIIEGESGTGKDLVANLVFALWNSRKTVKGAIVPVDCGTLRGELLLARLFGHKKGAFTGAISDQPGIFGAAENGGIFFDELANLSPEAQTLFLRVLESKRYTQVGATKEVDFNGRLFAATNKPLMPLVQSGKFRLDLYHRMNRIVIKTPNLRDHLSDIPAIATAYLNLLKPQIKEATGRDEVSFDMQALDSLMKYRWPGNVRELFAVIDRALVCMSAEENVIHEEHINFEGQVEDIVTANSPFDNCTTLLEHEVVAIKEALRICKNNQSQAATRLGISRSCLSRKIKQHGISIL